MSKVTIGKKVPAFKLAATGDQVIKLGDLKGSKVVIYFYPTEGLDFQANLAKFKRAGAVVLGVSRDSIASHEKFRDKQGFKFDLLSDPDETLCKMFDVIKEKNMYGKKIMGIERSTFLIDDKGVLKQEWRKVKVAGHVDEVLAAVKSLK